MNTFLVKSANFFNKNVTKIIFICLQANKKDEYSKKVYKLLITLHSEFSELIDLVENTGSIQREIRDLDDLINFERQQNVQQKLEQIMKDMEIVTGGGA